MKRRNFIRNIAFSSIAVGATPSILYAGEPSKEKTPNEKNEQKDGNEKVEKLSKVLGLGGVPLAGCWKKTSEQKALETLEKAWNLGIRYYDTSPRYGNGISERRMGIFLDGKPSDSYILSSKVGRILKPGVPPESQIGHLWKNKMNAVFHYDYSAAGTRKSIEDSLLRLGVNKLDYVFIHDLTPGNLGEDFRKYLEQAKTGAIPELVKMKEEGIIKGWGFGINSPEAVLETLEIQKPDICLMATQYSLLDHEEALNKTFPKLLKNEVEVVIGSPLNCGYLAGNETWNYSKGPAPKEIAMKRAEIEKVCHKHNVDMRTAALQFSMSHPVVSSVLTGCRNGMQIQENYHSLQENQKISKDFWDELKVQKLIAANAPIGSKL